MNAPNPSQILSLMAIGHAMNAAYTVLRQCRYVLAYQEPAHLAATIRREVLERLFQIMADVRAVARERSRVAEASALFVARCQEVGIAAAEQLMREYHAQEPNCEEPCCQARDAFPVEHAVEPHLVLGEEDAPF